ncbi:hypothetical protein VPG91_11625 [Nitrospirillum amazonense]|uniref:hypothetical protein n=1 Tax=Nitrospirillum amazonense TaxID=28077 RepID=UPI002DD42BD6|nr:hypothetical protein [Nitrospirillum amazonense]MEC4591639.1 hypothetical protein [Nitrospirillum amazonense]
MRGGRPAAPDLKEIDTHATAVVRGLVLLDQDLAAFPELRERLWATIHGVSNVVMDALEAAAVRERSPVQVRLRQAAAPGRA